MTKKLVLFTSLAGLALALSACSSSSDGNDDGAGGGNGDTAPKKHIDRDTVEDSAFKPTDLEATIQDLVDAIADTDAEDLQLNIILKTTTDYWEPVVVGANRALGELEVTGSVAATQEDSGEAAIEEQSAMIRENREQGSQGFGVAPFEAPVGEELDISVDAGIPVVTIDSDLAESKRDLYIGTLNAEAGETAGHTLLEYLPADDGTVIILGHDDAGWPDGYDRSMGAKAVLEDAGYTVVVRRTDWTETGEDADLEAMATIFAEADPPVVGMLGMFSNAYRCAMAAEAAEKTADDIAIAAFDFDAKTVEYMQSGMIKVTHAQRQYYMGYLTPYVLYGMNVLGKKETKKILADHMVDNYRFNAGLDVVKADTLDDYYSFLDSLGIGG